MMTTKLPWQTQPGYNRLFQPEKLTIGLIMPLETHPDRPAPTMVDHVEMAQLADRLGFAALWLRDVPFYDPHYGDVAQVFDPIPYIAYLGSVTTKIALGTAGIVLPMREPLILAKQAATLDHLTNGRLVLGLSSGDRPAEYPLFGLDYEMRGDRYRDAFKVLRTVSEEQFPTFQSDRFGQSRGNVDLIPKPLLGRVPALAVGRAQQSIAWVAENMDGFMSAAPNPELLATIAEQWHSKVREVGGGMGKPLSLGCFFDLTEDASYPFMRIAGGFRSGREQLLKFLDLAMSVGVSHIALNPKVSTRPYREIMDELAEHVLPSFPSI